MPVPADVQYCFDGAIELGSIGGDVYDYFVEFCPDTAEWFDRQENIRGIEGLAGFEENATKRYLEDRKLLSPDVRLFLSMRGAGWAHHHLREEVGRNTAWTALRQAWRNHGPDRALAKASSPTYLRRIARRYHAAFFKRAESIFARLDEDALNSTFVKANAVRDDMIEKRNARIADLSERIRGRVSIKDQRRRQKERRKVITRSANAAAKIVGEETARLYVRGDSITLTGRRFGFRLRKGSLSAHGHGSMSIELTDLGGEKLCSLCVYADNAPSMDQLSTLALYVMAGEEEDFIAAANLFDYTQHALTYPALRDLHSQQVAQFQARENALRAVGDPINDRSALGVRAILGSEKPDWAYARQHIEFMVPVAFNACLPLTPKLALASRRSQGAIGKF